MSKRNLIRKEIAVLYGEGVKVLEVLNKKENASFSFEYQRWYTKALKAVKSLAPDRYNEFRGYYEIDPKRKALGYGTFVIQDFLKNVVPSRSLHPEFDGRKQALQCFLNQLSIFQSISERIDSVIANIEGELFAEIQDNEIVVARELAKINLRAAGALMGVVIEGHLQKVAANHSVNVAKKNPTISDLNDPLKAASVVDTPAWRKISYLADLRNICSHKKEIEPTKEQVGELIDGTEWVIKNVF